jgi:DNA-binding transcriptional LysR family regulator
MTEVIARSGSFLDTQRLRTFVAVAQESNITRAAALLHMTQQAVSTHVQRLERELGVKLLVRQTKGVVLTPAGQELAARSTALLAQLDEVRHSVQVVGRRTEKRTLRLAAGLAATSAVTRIAEAVEARAGIEVEIVAVPSETVCVQQLTSGGVDAALMWLPIEGQLFTSAVVRVDPRVVALPSTHRLAGRTSVTLADLADEPVVMPDLFASETARRHWLIDPRPGGGPALRGPCVPGVLEALMMVARGRGVWLAPRPVADWKVVPGVTWLPVTDAEPTSAAVLWLPQTPPELIRPLVAEARATTGWKARPRAGAEAASRTDMTVAFQRQ